MKNLLWQHESFIKYIRRSTATRLLKKPKDFLVLWSKWTYLSDCSWTMSCYLAAVTVLLHFVDKLCHSMKSEELSSKVTTCSFDLHFFQGAEMEYLDFLFSNKCSLFACCLKNKEKNDIMRKKNSFLQEIYCTLLYCTDLQFIPIF